MDEELKLGFHRLGRALEDPVNMGLALAIALRRPIELAARRWHDGRIALEESHPRFTSHA